MTEYVTDRDADHQGIIRLGDIYLNGIKGNLKNDRHIGLIIRAPNSRVVADKINIQYYYKPIEIREAKSFFCNKLTTYQYYNDGCQITSSNTHIREYVTHSTIRKLYSNSNHPDILQLWSWHRNKVLYNVIIDSVDAYIRGCSKHAGIHFTETNLYRHIYIGLTKLKINMDSDEYPYWLSAINLTRSIIGNENLSIGNRKVRIDDVKTKRLISKGVKLVGVDSRDLESMWGNDIECCTNWPTTRDYTLASSTILNTTKPTNNNILFLEEAAGLLGIN